MGLIRHHVWFHDCEGVGRVHSWLRREFRHCLRATRGEDEMWLVRDFTTSGDFTTFLPEGHYYAKLFSNAADADVRVLAISLPEDWEMSLPSVGVTCAAVTAHSLGVKLRFPWTPFTLYKQLVAAGAEHIIGDPV